MKPLIILVGHSGSQKIVKASKYLTEKYLPGFNVIYLNYKEEINGWGTYVAGFLEYLTDDQVIFALDDYLISDSIDIDIFNCANKDIGGDAVCVKLCHATAEENLQYPVTTQFCLWNRKYLIHLLFKYNTPWEFEILGSKEFNMICLYRPCLKYFTNSALSSRWSGVKFDGLNVNDIKYIKKLI